MGNIMRNVLGKKIIAWALVTLFVFLGLVGSGCIEPYDPTVATVQTYLEAKNTSDYTTASLVVDSKYQSKGYIMMTWTRVEGTKNKRVENVELSSGVSGNQAVVIANYTETTYDENAHNKIGEENVTQYFKVTNIDGKWMITKISTDPMSQPVATGAVKKTPLDHLTDNAIFILPAALAMLAAGVMIDRREKAKKGGAAGAGGSGGGGGGSIMIQTAQISRFVRCVPSRMGAGSAGTVDVWIKNFNQQQYSSVVVTAAFPDGVKVNKKKLKFGTIEPGQTAKQTWNVKPSASGMFPINDVTVAFTFGGKRYAGALDPVGLQVA